MFNNNTDGEWEKFGNREPYFGVIASNEYRKLNLTDERKQEFFKSGSIYIDSILEDIKNYLGKNDKITKALDFGCGVGRLVIPLAQIAESVTGIDISDSMLNEAKNNCEARNIKNVNLVKSDDKLSLLKGKYDFIHSFIVFQHIPEKRGKQIFENLIKRLENGGICVINFTYAKNYSNVKKFMEFIKNYIPFAKNFNNLIKGRNLFSPYMQMNIYNLNQLFFIVQKYNISDFHVKYTNHGEELGIIMYFKKP